MKLWRRSYLYIYKTYTLLKTIAFRSPERLLASEPDFRCMRQRRGGAKSEFTLFSCALGAFTFPPSFLHHALVFCFGLAPPARKRKKREKSASPHVWSSVSFSCVACYCDRFRNVAPQKTRLITSARKPNLNFEPPYRIFCRENPSSTRHLHHFQ